MDYFHVESIPWSSNAKGSPVQIKLTGGRTDNTKATKPISSKTLSFYPCTIKIKSSSIACYMTISKYFPPSNALTLGNDAHHLHTHRRRRNPSLLQTLPPSRGLFPQHRRQRRDESTTCGLGKSRRCRLHCRHRRRRNPWYRRPRSSRCRHLDCKAVRPLSKYAHGRILMTLCGGLHPNRTLPVVLDVGTDVLNSTCMWLIVE